MLICWVVTPCDLVGRHQRFGGTCCLHIQGWNPHSLTTQKTNVDMTQLSQPCLRKRDATATVVLWRRKCRFAFDRLIWLIWPSDFRIWPKRLILLWNTFVTYYNLLWSNLYRFVVILYLRLTCYLLLSYTNCRNNKTIFTAFRRLFRALPSGKNWRKCLLCNQTSAVGVTWDAKGDATFKSVSPTSSSGTEKEELSLCRVSWSHFLSLGQPIRHFSLFGC
jgi:hypothetical protein